MMFTESNMYIHTLSRYEVRHCKSNSSVLASYDLIYSLLERNAAHGHTGEVSWYRDFGVRSHFIVIENIGDSDLHAVNRHKTTWA